MRKRKSRKGKRQAGGITVTIPVLPEKPYPSTPAEWEEVSKMLKSLVLNPPRIVDIS